MSRKWFRQNKTTFRRARSRPLRSEALEARRVMAIDSDAVHFLQASGYFEMVERFNNPATNPLENPLPTGVGIAVAQRGFPQLGPAANQAPNDVFQGQPLLGFPEKRILDVWTNAVPYGRSDLDASHDTFTVGRRYYGNAEQTAEGAEYRDRDGNLYAGEAEYLPWSLAPGVEHVYAYNSSWEAWSLHGGSWQLPDELLGRVINYIGVPGSAVDINSIDNYRRLAYLIDRAAPVVEDPEDSSAQFAQGFIAVMSAGDNGENVIEDLPAESGIGNAIIFNSSLQAQQRLNVAPAGFEPDGFQVPDFVVYAGSNSEGHGRVGGAVAALLQTPLELDNPVSQAHSQRPEVIKALLMAGATKGYHDFEALRNDQSAFESTNLESTDYNPSDSYYQPHVWSRISDGQPLDPEYGAGLMNIDHSYRILQAGEQRPSNDPEVDPTGWDYNWLNAEGAREYTLTLSTAQSFSAALTWHQQFEAEEGTHDGSGNTLTAATAYEYYDPARHAASQPATITVREAS